MTPKKAAAYCSIAALFAFASQPSYAERWVQVDSADPKLWYDADSVRTTTNSLLTLWISSGPSRTSRAPDGTAVYPTYSVIDCRGRTAGSKINFDLGQPLQPYDASSSMGELITKLCSFQNANG